MTGVGYGHIIVRFRCIFVWKNINYDYNYETMKLLFLTVERGPEIKDLEVGGAPSWTCRGVVVHLCLSQYTLKE